MQRERDALIHGSDDTDSHSISAKRVYWDARTLRLFNGVITGTTGTLMVAGIYVLLMHMIVKETTLLPWLSFMLSMCAARYTILLAFRRRRKRSQLNIWLRSYEVLVGLTGIAWAYAGYFLMPSEIFHQALIMVLFAGVAAVSVQTLAWSRAAMLAMILLVLAPMTLRLFLYGDELRLIMAAMGAIYLVLTLRLGYSTRQSLTNSLELTLRNQQLIDDLRERTNATTRLNQSLQLEVESRIRMADELEKSRQQAESASLAKSEFLAHMSHELRTPLNAIMGFAQLLNMESKDQSATEYAEEIMGASKHLLTLIDEVLDLSRIESGRLEVKLEHFNLASMVDECRVLIQGKAEERGLTLDTRVDSAATVFADRNRLKQVLLNLLSNAVKYNRHSGNVHVRAAPAATGYLRVSVEDTGSGIAAEKLPLVFQPFERLGAELSNIEGTGIGLALAKRLIESMGGSLGAESVVNSGSTFWFEIATD